MAPIVWKLGVTAIAGAVFGLVGGQATIAGISQPPPARPSYPQNDGQAAIDYAVPSREPADYARIADACSECSDYDLGYRFAASRRLRTTAECMDYSWSYQRGCLAYLREG